jgi:hypothetical protein
VLDIDTPADYAHVKVALHDAPVQGPGRDREEVAMSDSEVRSVRSVRLYPDGGSPVVMRVLWLYGVYMLVSNAAFLVGYYLLPEGIFRQGPVTAAGRVVAAAPSFASELLLTLLFNLGMVVTIAVVMNLNRVRGLPLGYLYPVSLGIVGGLIPGTNSFVASNLSDFTVREGMALGLSIGNVEMLGYICVIAATVGLGIYEYRSWWRWGGEWRAVKTKAISAVRLSRAEIAVFAAGLGLVIFAAVRETMMARGSL